jgi:hypothetical protein
MNPEPLFTIVSSVLLIVKQAGEQPRELSLGVLGLVSPAIPSNCTWYPAIPERPVVGPIKLVDIPVGGIFPSILKLPFRAPIIRRFPERERLDPPSIP